MFKNVSKTNFLHSTLRGREKRVVLKLERRNGLKWITLERRHTETKTLLHFLCHLDDDTLEL